MGYHRAGFDVIGIDIRKQPRYPFPFIQADALRPPVRLEDFDLIHASPPCQAYSVAAIQQRNNGVRYPDSLSATRVMLEGSRRPWIIENVPGAPMRSDVTLCGCMFDLPLLRRERWFETSWNHFQLLPLCQHVGPALSVTGHGVGAGNGQRARIAAHIGKNPGIGEARAAMGIDWMNRGELSQSIPPAYTEFLGRAFLRCA